VLNIAFKVADEQGLLLLDMKDLRARSCPLSPNTAAELTTQYGNVSKQTVGKPSSASFLVLENQGGTKFFRRAGAGAKRISCAPIATARGHGSTFWSADKLDAEPRSSTPLSCYGCLSEFVRGASGGGRSAKNQKLVFFFDEAHLFVQTMRRRR